MATTRTCRCPQDACILYCTVHSTRHCVSRPAPALHAPAEQPVKKYEVFAWLILSVSPTSLVACSRASTVLALWTYFEFTRFSDTIPQIPIQFFPEKVLRKLQTSKCKSIRSSWNPKSTCTLRYHLIFIVSGPFIYCLIHVYTIHMHITYLKHSSKWTRTKK